MSVGFDYRTLKDWRNRDSWRAQTKACVPQDAGERSCDITRDSQACLCVQEPPGWYGLTVAAAESGELITTVLGAVAGGHKSI